MLSSAVTRVAKAAVARNNKTVVRAMGTAKSFVSLEMLFGIVAGVLGLLLPRQII